MTNKLNDINLFMINNFCVPLYTKVPFLRKNNFETYFVVLEKIHSKETFDQNKML